MFRKPQINVSFSRQPKTAEETTPITDTINKIDWERINTLTQQTMKKAVLLGVVAYAAKKTVDTTSEIAIVAATSTFNS